MERSIVFVIHEGFQPLDLVGPHEVFQHAGRLAGGYRCQVVAPRSGPVRAASGLPVHAGYGVDDLIPRVSTRWSWPAARESTGHASMRG